MTISAGAGGSSGIECPSDLKPLSGGYEAPPFSFQAYIDAPQVEFGTVGWQVGGQNLTNAPLTVKIYVVCARVSP